MVPKFLQIGPQKIAYYESGGKGQPVLLIHGNSMSGFSFEKQFESPLGEKYRLIAMDLPGHGRSAHAKDPKAAYSLPGYAGTISEFVKALELDNAVFVGSSLGGHILLEAAVLLTDAKGFMIIGTPPVGFPVPFSEAFLLSQEEAPIMFKRELTPAEVDLWINRLFGPLGSGRPEFFRHVMLATDGTAREALGISIAEGNSTDEVKIVAALNVPLAVIHGEKESVANLSYMRKLIMPTLWRGNIQIIPDAGHMPHWEQPERFNGLLDEFIKDIQKK